MKSDEIIAKRIRVRDLIAELKAKHEAELKPYKEAEDLLDGAIMSIMDNMGLTQIKGEHGTAFFKTVMSVKTADRGALFDYVREHDAFSLLTSAVSKDAVAEFIDGHGGNPPPGVDVAMTRVVQIRRS